MDSIDFVDEKVFRRAFEDWYHPLCFYAARILGEDHAVYDLVQEVFLRTWERRIVFETDGSMRAYLYSSVYNACLNRQRSSGTHRRHHVLMRDDVRRTAPENLPFLTDRIEAEVFAEIFEAIDRLPSECRKVFELSYIKGLSVEGVATELGISVNTVKSQRSRAKKLLKEMLKDLYSILLLMLVP